VIKEHVTIMKEVMVDLETMGNGPNAAIVQIGACYFSLSNGTIGKTFLVNVNLESVMANGALVDASTILWWLGQSKEAQNSILGIEEFQNVETKDEDAALKEFNEFVAPAKHIWSHATFDFVILMNAMRRLNIRTTFNYKSERDIRTLVGLLPKGVDLTQIERTGLRHNALADAVNQAVYCSFAYNVITGWMRT